jgi:uncharacterized repeat protein (TIGR04076 family)
MDKKEIIKEMMQQAVGITDEDFETYLSYPKNLAIAEGTPELMKYKIIAEVTESKYCSAGLKTGQKYTFNALPAMLLPEESDCPLCARSIAPIGNILGGIWDKILKGTNSETKEIVGCLDPGVEKGGLGHVVFKVYAQKKG